MARDPKYDILFDPIRLGPNVAKNRLFQTSHCMGGGSERPGFQAHHRAVKAEGGWAVVGTEYCAVAPESEDSPRVSARLWDNGDARNLSLMTEMAHEHGALASVQLWYGGPFSGGMESRMPGVRRAASHSSVLNTVMVGGREMSKEEIREVQGYYVRAARLARGAGFDIITILCSTGVDITHQFLLPAFNRRTDEYGGRLENRARFALETFERVREAVGDHMALSIRYGVDTLAAPYGMGDVGISVDGDGGGFMELADHLVDMWDLTIGGIEWGEQAGPSRTHRENWSAELMRKARQHTSKVVGNVGRLTNPDTMVAMIQSGQCDVISAARPTISDPYIPKKIHEGRLEDIRECIGCNICISRYEIGGPPIVCTQNATVGEEYRRGWHPEKFTTAKNADNDVLVVGAGPAGMECARVLGERGMRRVHLVEAEHEIGGNVRFVSQLPGLGEWARVINYRQVQLNKLKNVEVITRKRLTAQDVLGYGAEIVVVATGSSWSPDGLNGLTHKPLAGANATTQAHVLTPDQVFAGKDPGQRVVVYDLDGYFMAAGLAERFAHEGRQVTYVTMFASAASYTEYTLEHPRLVRSLLQLGVEIVKERAITKVQPGFVSMTDVWDESTSELEVDGLVLVAQRLPEESLFVALRNDNEARKREGITALYRAGDCAVPGTIADAVFEGHRLARELDSPNPAYPLPYIRERRLLNATEEDYMLDSPTIAYGDVGVRA